MGWKAVCFTFSAVFMIAAVRSFFMDVHGVIYGADQNGEPADENDPPIEE